MNQKLSFETLPQAVGLLTEKIENLERLLLEISGKKKNDPPGQLMTIDQAAEFLNLAKPTVYSMVSRGELPHMKRSKRLYFSREDLMGYIRDGRRLTNAETKDEASNYVSIRGKEVRHA